MKTEVIILRGAWRGRTGWIAGTLEDRRARGVTKALVRIDGDLPELLSIENLRPADQLALFGSPAASLYPGDVGV